MATAWRGSRGAAARDSGFAVELQPQFDGSCFLALLFLIFADVFLAFQFLGSRETDSSNRRR
jgi:hypothetical protein